MSPQPPRPTRDCGAYSNRRTGLGISRCRQPLHCLHTVSIGKISATRGHPPLGPAKHRTAPHCCMECYRISAPTPRAPCCNPGLVPCFGPCPKLLRLPYPTHARRTLASTIAPPPIAPRTPPATEAQAKGEGNAKTPPQHKPTLLLHRSALPLGTRTVRPATQLPPRMPMHGNTLPLTLWRARQKALRQARGATRYKAPGCTKTIPHPASQRRNRTGSEQRRPHRAQHHRGALIRSVRFS